MVRHVVSEAWNPQPVVSAMCSVDFKEAIASEENHFAVIIAKNMMGNDFGVEAPLELQRQIADLEALDAWFVGSSGQNVLVIRRHLDCRTFIGHLKVLDQLNSLAKIDIAFQ